MFYFNLIPGETEKIESKINFNSFWYLAVSKSFIHISISNIFLLSRFSIFYQMFYLVFAGPVTIADQTAEESMVSIILEKFPSHAM